MTTRGYDKNERFRLSYNDQQGAITTGRVTAAWTVEAYRDTGFRMAFLRHNQDDEIHMEFQLDHGFIPESDIELHMHAIPMANVSGNVYFEYHYFWGKIGQVVPALSGWESGNITVPVLGTDQYVEKYYDLLDISNTNDSNESSILRVYLSRLGTDALDTYDTNKDHGTGAANFGIDYFDLHIPVYKLGTDNAEPPFNN